MGNTLIKPKKFVRPDATLREASKKAKDAEPRIRKTVTTFGVRKAAGEEGDTTPSIYRPTDEQLAMVNQYTRSPKTADEVACFDTWSCNDQLDRDLDAFTPDTVKGFAALEEPFGPNGKSFMVGHDYSKLPVGRIFGSDTAKQGDALFLTNSVYMPNTEQHKNFLENVDFGIYWAVSVGVVLESSTCVVCSEHMYRSGFCERGHIKGEWYPEGDEGDTSGWEWAESVPPGTKGAVMCTGVLEGARDFYELSMCFLGSQLGAELQRRPEFAGIMKAASGGVPLLGLTAEEAQALPLPRLPARLREAVIEHRATSAPDGTYTWTDASGLVWAFDPEDTEVTCLGKAAEEDEHADGSDEQGRGEPSEEPDALGSEDGEQQGSGSGEELDDGEGDDEAGDPEQERAGGVGQVEAAARAAGFSGDILTAAAKGLTPLLRSLHAQLQEREREVAELAPRAAIGAKYVETLRSDALHWYAKARIVPGQQKGAQTEGYERILAALGDDVDLLLSAIDEQRSIAQLRFPETVGARRSSEPIDPEERGNPEPLVAPDNQQDGRVARLHNR